MPNISSVSPGGFVAFIDSQTAEEIVQVAATSFNPAGLTGAMDSIAHGITIALEAAGNSDTIAVVNIAIPSTVDKTEPCSVRLGWSTPSTTTGNEIDFSISYRYLGATVATNGAADGEVHSVENPTAIANEYQYATFALPAPGAGARVIQLLLTRYGSSDSESAVANSLGIIAAFTPIKQGS